MFAERGEALEVEAAWHCRLRRPLAAAARGGFEPEETETVSTRRRERRRATARGRLCGRATRRLPTKASRKRWGAIETNQTWLVECSSRSARSIRTRPRSGGRGQYDCLRRRIRFERAPSSRPWGGATLPEGGGGIYRATVAYRGSFADRGFRYLRDGQASDDSRPILSVSASAR